jgi:lactoylglutathione lyase
MALQFIDAMILYTADLTKTVEFYRKLGLPLESEEHEEGPAHFACGFGGAHIAFYECGDSTDKVESKALPRGYTGAMQLGFRVDSVDGTLAIAVECGAKILIEPQAVPWGRRAVFEDPNGRPIEINQSIAI